MQNLIPCVISALAFAVAASARAETLTLTTSRGAKVDVVADLPSGPGPFPAVVLAPGQGYHMALPALDKTAQRLVSQGIAVYRFNWAYMTATPKAGTPSEGLVDELQDLHAVLAAAQAEPRVRSNSISVGGKSLGSIVAWRAFVANKALHAGLFLTPVCSRLAKGQSVPTSHADEYYPGVAAENRPVLFISGDRDPLCALPVLYRFAANAGGPARVAVVGGDHGYENKSLAADAAQAAHTRNVSSVASLAADFLVEMGGR